MSEQEWEIAVTELQGFKNYPFQVKDDESFQEFCGSIQKCGVLSLLLARPTEDGYEIAGHRRKAAALSLGLDKLPVLVRDMSDDEANRTDEPAAA